MSSTTISRGLILLGFTVMIASILSCINPFSSMTEEDRLNDAKTSHVGRSCTEV